MTRSLRTHIHHTARAALAAMLCTVLCGCGSSGRAPFEVPIAELQSTSLTELASDSTTVTFDVDVRNPTGEPVSLQGTAYRLTSGGALIASGREDLAYGEAAPKIAPKAVQSVPVKAKVSSTQLLSALPLAKGGDSAPFEADVFVNVDTLGAGPVTLTVKGQGTIPVPASMGVEVQGLLLEPAGGPADGWAGLRVVNHNGYVVQVSSLNLQVTIDERITGSGTMTAGATSANGAKGADGPIPPGQGQELDLPISLRITGTKPTPGTKVAYTISGTATVTSSRGTMTIPLLGKGTSTIMQ